MLLDTAATAAVPLQITTDTLVNTFVIPIATFVVGFLAVYFVGKTVLTPVVERVLDSKGFDSSVKSLADSIMGVVVWVLALTVALTLAGFGGFIAALGVFGGAVALAVGFAAQDLLGNFVAGIFILKDKPFQVGDWIEVNGITGRVQDIDLRVTRVKTFDNELVTVPNGDLANNALTNPVAFDKLRQKFVFGIGYDDDIEQASAAIVDELEAHPEVMEEPGPDVRVTELGDSAVGLQSRFWIADPNRADFARIRSEIVQAVKERFDAEGIDMPYPHTQLTGGIDVDGIQTASATPSDD